MLGIYNPASRSRTTQVADAKADLLGAQGGTVVVVGRDVGHYFNRWEVAATLEKPRPRRAST